MKIIVKTLVYRVYSYTISFAILWLLTGHLPKAAILSLVVELIKILQYFYYESTWEAVATWHSSLASHLVLKSVLYRVFSFGIAFFLFSLLTREVRTATEFAGATEFAKLFSYYAFDRLWRRRLTQGQKKSL